MIYDISQPVFACEVFPGDPCPEKIALSRMEEGALYDLTAFSMCAHNGTHVDAPRHFIKQGKGIGEIELEKFVGPALVVSHAGDVTAQDACEILAGAENVYPAAARKILIKGRATVTLAAAEVFAKAGVELLGNESQTVGPEEAPMAVHLALLGAGVVLLEGIRLTDVPDGVYILNCAPLDLGCCDGAPCRAILIKMNNE